MLMNIFENPVELFRPNERERGAWQPSGPTYTLEMLVVEVEAYSSVPSIRVD